jgi:ketosteroid isomerase-like protein
MNTIKNDEESIRTLMNHFVAAFNSGDIDAIMKNYAPDKSLVIFDLVPRQEYRGADTYRRYWAEMFSHFKGNPQLTISDLGVTADGKTGFGHSFQRLTGTDKQGRRVDRMVRVTNGYLKTGNNWLIALEHVSVPVDLQTGKAQFPPKPASTI